jgi:predicted small integral membrane protein
MAMRYFKIDFVILISLLCLIYAGQNVVNLDACYQTFAYVMSNADHQAYPDSFFPAIQSPTLIWLMLILVVGLEFTAGLLAAKGAWDLWGARKASASSFNAAKKYALLGCSTGIIVWLGLFLVFGGALFQMWQTQIGAGSLANSFQFFMACGLVFIIVNLDDD